MAIWIFRGIMIFIIITLDYYINQDARRGDIELPAEYICGDAWC